MDDTVEIQTKMNIEDFNLKLKVLVSEENMPYIDAVCLLCEENELEYEDIPKYIDAKTKMYLENEYREMNYLPRISTLPL
jgi:hypothetical protein